MLAVLAVFGASIGFGWTNWDDFEAITGNPLVRSPLSRGLRHALTTPELGYPQPTTLWTHHIDWLIGGGSPWPFHATNVALHGACAVIVRHLARSYGVTGGWSLVAGLAFGLHPVVVEPVCWATGRKDLLAALATLATVGLYRGGPLTARRAAAVFACFLAGLGSKPIAVVAVALLALDHAANRRRPTRAEALLLGLMTACAGANVALSLSSQSAVGALAPARSPFEIAAYVLQHWALLLRNVVAPFQLSPLYFEHLPRPWLSGWGALGMLAALATGWWVARAWKSDPALRFFGLWPIVTFLPSSGLIGLTRGPADTYAYLPLAGLAVALAAACQSYGRRAAALAPVVGGALLAWALLSMRQSQIWQGASTLWQAVVKQYPDEPSAHQNLGDALLLEGRPERALPHLERALSLWPLPQSEPTGMLAVADACFFLHRYECATRWYAETVRRFGPSRSVAFRLGGATQAAPIDTYRAEQAWALQTARAALGAIARGDETARKVYAESIAPSPVARAGITRFASDPQLGETASVLLEMDGAARAPGAARGPAGASRTGGAARPGPLNSNRSH